MEEPFIRVEDTGELFPMRPDVTTIGRGKGVDVRLTDPSVSRLHAEIVRRGPYAYVTDLGLSRNGTRVNGRPVARRLLEDGDVVSFGSARCRVGGLPHEDLVPDVELRRSATPELTRRELDVLTSLCRPALSDEAFVAPATAREIAADLVVTEAAVKQHLLRLYQKFRIPEGSNRRTRLANEVVALGLVRPLPSASGARPEPLRAPATAGPPESQGPGSGGQSTPTAHGPQGGSQPVARQGPSGAGSAEAASSRAGSTDAGPRGGGGGSPGTGAGSPGTGGGSHGSQGGADAGPVSNVAGGADAPGMQAREGSEGDRDARHIRRAGPAPPRARAAASGRSRHAARRRAS